MTDIHSTAIVHPNAELGENVSVGAFTIINEDVRIGAGTSIGPHCIIDNGARIGANCRIHNGAVIATPPQDLKYKNERTECFIGDNTEIREYATINRGTTYSYKVVVGSKCLLMAYSHVAHDCVLGDNVILANAAQLGGHCVIGNNAIIGGLTAIHQFCHVGPFVMISGASGANKDVPPYVRAGHFPIQFAGVNTIGLRRNGFSRDAIERIGECYKIIYHSGRNVSQAVEHIEATMEHTPEVETIINFIKTSPRGIVKASRITDLDD